MSNARIGKDSENLIKNYIRNHQTELIPKFAELFEHISEGDEILSVSRVGSELEKTDVLMRFRSDTTLAASVKAFKSNIGFNQVVRKSITKFCTDIGMGNVIEQHLIRCTISKARNKGSWIDKSAEDVILRVIEEKLKRILQYSFCGEDNPHLLILTTTDTKEIAIYKMENFLEHLLKRANVGISKRGVIIINEFITIQRKGGNGKHVKTPPKDSIKHPGNNIQVKLNCRKVLGSDIPKDISVAIPLGAGLK